MNKLSLCVTLADKMVTLGYTEESALAEATKYAEIFCNAFAEEAKEPQTDTAV